MKSSFNRRIVISISQEPNKRRNKGKFLLLCFGKFQRICHDSLSFRSYPSAYGSRVNQAEAVFFLLAIVADGCFRQSKGLFMQRKLIPNGNVSSPSKEIFGLMWIYIVEGCPGRQGNIELPSSPNRSGLTTSGAPGVISRRSPLRRFGHD